VSVAVYPRLEELLRERNLTVAELKRQIVARYGLTFDQRTLDRLAQREPVRRADLTIAGAAAQILGVGLGDLFAVEAIPVGVSSHPDDDLLDDDQAERMLELLDLQDERPLTRSERRELRGLVDEYGRRFCEYHDHRIAERRGVPVEEVRREAEERIARARVVLHELEANPRRRQAFIEDAKQRIAAAQR
jgi:hypothetical protein